MLVEDIILSATTALSVTVVVPKPQWYEMRVHQNDKNLSLRYAINNNIVFCIVCYQQGYELMHGSIMIPYVSS